MSSASRKEARHARWRTKRAALLRVVDPTTVRDPLHRPAHARRVWFLALLGCAFVSMFLHGAVVVAASLLPAQKTRPTHAPLQISVLAAPESMPPPVAPPPPPPPVAAPPPVPPPLALRRPPEPSRPVVDPTPPDPSEPPVAEPVPTATPRRRVVGIGLESTTTAGAGPAYAAGNTRMGETAGVAGDPNTMGGHTGRSFTPPRRKSEPAPQYPPALRERGVEGEVGIEAAIDASGAVTRISVVRRSAYPEFDRAAAEAAGRGTYEPAKLDGVAVANVIAFTVRFRLHP